MQAAWRIDDHNPYEDSFEEALLSHGVAENLEWVLEKALRRIQEDPQAGDSRLVDDTRVYVARIPHRTPSGRLLVYLIAYVIDADKNVIQPLSMTRSEDELTDEALRKAIARFSPCGLEPQVVLFPDEPTTLPAEAIEAAVKRAINRSK